MSHLIIDAYNLIRRSATLSSIEARDFEQGREALIQAVSAYARVTGHRVTLVFDAGKTDRGTRTSESRHGVTVLFTRGDETADDVINEMVSCRDGQTIVVSSDRAIIEHAKSCRALAVDAKTFERTMQQAVLMSRSSIFDKEDEEGGRLSSKKKGPARRLPKDKRQALSVLKKTRRGRS